MTAMFLWGLPLLIVGALAAAALRSNRASAAVALVTQGLALAVVLPGLAPIALGAPAFEARWRWSAPVESISIRVDALSAFFLCWSLPMTLLGTVFAVGYLRPHLERGRHGGPHYALLNLVSASFVIVYTVENALVFLLGWEVAAIAAWLLVIWDYRSQKIRFAGFNYLVSTHVGLFALVAAFMWLHARTDSMDFAAFGAYLGAPGAARGRVFLLLGAAVALKAAFFPFHTWLPRAHAAAPAHVSALMSGVIHKAGLFALLRFLPWFRPLDEWMGWSIVGLGAASAFFGGLSTSTPRDLKRLLGYSSTENVGIAAIGFGVGALGLAWGAPALAATGFAGGLLHVFNHAWFKCLLFYAAGAVHHATHTVDLERLGGLARRLPVTALLFLVGAAAIMGLPPLNGFASELLVLTGLLSRGAPDAGSNLALVAVAALLGFVGAVSMLSMTRAFGIAFLGAPRDPRAHTGGDPPATMRAPMWAHAAGAVALGLAPELGLALVRASVDGLVPAPHAPVSLGAAAWASRALAAALLVFGALAWLRQRAARTTETWACGYRATTPRMQVTGAAFAAHFARIFEGVLPVVRRERPPRGAFPEGRGHLETHHPDPVERRMFEVLDQGDDLVTHAAERISEQPRFAFALGLVALLVVGALVSEGWVR